MEPKQRSVVDYQLYRIELVFYRLLIVEEVVEKQK